MEYLTLFILCRSMYAKIERSCVISRGPFFDTFKDFFLGGGGGIWLVLWGAYGGHRIFFWHCCRFVGFVSMLLEHSVVVLAMFFLKINFVQDNSDKNEKAQKPGRFLVLALYFIFEAFSKEC